MEKIASIPLIKIDFHPPLTEDENIKLLHDFLIKNEEKLSGSFTQVEMLPKSPKILSVFLISKHHSSNIKKVFEEFIEKRIVPGNETIIVSSRLIFFTLPEISTETFIFCRADVFIDLTSDFFDATENFYDRIKIPLTLGIHSTDLFNIAIESSFGIRNRNVLNIQHELAKVFRRFPTWKKTETAVFLRHCLCCIKDHFLEPRDIKYISQTLLRLYFLEQKLERESFKNSSSRHMYLRIKPCILHYRFGSKETLGILFGTTFFDNKEIFDESLVKRVIVQKFPSFLLVKDTFFSPPKHNKKHKVFYFELEKINGKQFSKEEMQEIHCQLPKELKSCISSLIPFLKISRNEEEIMKMILQLSNEICDIQDLPQAFISYDHHNEDQIVFRVIFVRIEKEYSENFFKKMLEKGNKFIKIQWEKEQVIRFMDKGIVKKVYVFQAFMQADMILEKMNSSGFLYFARQRVVIFLEKMIGEFRDYNGGMIEKQKECYESFKRSFPEKSSEHAEMIESFFFALTPIESQVTSSFEELKTLFTLLLTIFEKPLKDSLLYQTSYENKIFFLVLKIKKSTFSKKLFEKLNLLQKNNVFSLFTIEQTNYLALFSKSEKQNLVDIESVIKNYQKEINEQQILRLSFEDLPLSLDPRLGGDYITDAYNKMLFEGLMRFGPKNKIQLAIAKSYKIFNQNKQYVFHLRRSYWSNGDLLTAGDFEYAWKSILNPDFQTPFDYLFYPIQNAKLAKEGRISHDKIGIKSLNDSTLLVDLEYPFPSFLELLSLSIYSPINRRIDEIYPNWSGEEGDRFVCNGPFLLQSRSTDEFILIKNPIYWDANSVNLQSISLIKADAKLALELFQNNQIDWLGRPIYPWHPLFNLVNKIEKQDYLPTCVHWLVLNTKKFPFHVKEIRQSFAKAIDREKMLKDLSYDGEPAYTPLPKQHTLHKESSCLSYSPEKALELFEYGLKKLGITRRSFPTLQLACINSSIRKKIAEKIKEHLSSTLKIDIIVEPYNWPHYFRNMCEGNFYMGCISWQTWLDDPSYTLESFADGKRKTNFSKWENSIFTFLVQKGFFEPNPTKRLEYWKNAENLLIDNVPVIPTFYEVYRCVKKPYLRDTLINYCQNIVDFKLSKICKKY